MLGRKGAEGGGVLSRWLRAARAVERHPWAFALLLGVAGWQLAFVRGPSIPADYRVFAQAGTALLHGDLAGVFSSPVVQAGPLEVLGFGVLQILTGGLPIDVQAQVLSLLLCLGNAAAMVAIVRSVKLAHGTDRPVLAPVGLAALVYGAVTLVDAHPTHAAIALLWVLAARRASTDRALAAALLMGVGVALDSWAVLGVPVLLLLPGWWRRARCCGVIVACALVAWGPFIVSGGFRSGEMAWAPRPGSLPHALGTGAAGWGYRLLQAAVVVLLGAVMASRTRHTAASVWLVPVAVVCARIATDPVMFDYYGKPVVLLLLAGLSVTGWPLGVKDVCCAAALLWVLYGDSLAGPLLGYGPALVLLLLPRLLWTGELKRQPCCAERMTETRGHVSGIERWRQHV
jgi:hypothetical protein